MKWVTFTFASVLTTCIVISGIALYPEVLGRVATTNNDFVFAVFLGPFFVVLFFSWVGEKVVLKVWKRKA